VIPVNLPLLDGNEKKYLLECIETGWISSEGPFVGRFEKEFAARMGRRHGIAVCNGTAAIDIAIEALELRPGDEIIMPAFTIISCVSQLVRNGVVPVLADSDPRTWNMDVGQLESLVTPRTRAIMVVHTYGLPVDMDPVLDLARRHGLKVIEDAAESHGLTYRGRPCGSFGDISTFSFYPNKHVTTGEGGMVLADDDALGDASRSLRNLCFETERFVHRRLGWNCRMTNMQAALGVAQLERLDEFTAIKRRMGARYTELLSGHPMLQLPLPRTDYADNIYWVFGVLLDESLGTAKDMARRLAEAGIGTRPFFCPMHMQPVLLERGLFAGQRFPVAERMWKQGLYLPSGMALRPEEIDEVAAKFLELLQ
jgi:perosamine synthetase